VLGNGNVFIKRCLGVGVGEALSLERTRMLLALRINVLAKGHSGITLNTLQQYVAAFNSMSTNMSHYSALDCSLLEFSIWSGHIVHTGKNLNWQSLKQSASVTSSDS